MSSQELEIQKLKQEAFLQRDRLREETLQHEKQSKRIRELEEIALGHEKRIKILEHDLSYYKGDEVVKTGTIQTDSLTHFKNGMTLRDTKVRANQTSNAEQIIILHDFLSAVRSEEHKFVKQTLFGTILLHKLNTLYSSSAQKRPSKRRE